MLFTVIVPVYNGEQYLPNCLTSVAEQTCNDFELVVVDDGSRDDSGLIADQFAATHDNTCVLHNRNEGLLLARRRGIRAAHGQYVVFLDADDALSPSALANVAALIKETSADIVSFGFSRNANFSTADDLVPLENRLYDGSDYYIIKHYVLEGKLNNLCGKAFRLSCIDSETSYEQYAGLMMAEDLLQLLPIVNSASKFVRTNELLYYVRPNDASSTHTYKQSYLGDIETVSRALLKYGHSWGMPVSANKGVCVLYTFLAKLLVHYGDLTQIHQEIPHLADSLESLPDGCAQSIDHERIDRKLILKAVLNKNSRRTTRVVRLIDYMATLIRRENR